MDPELRRWTQGTAIMVGGTIWMSVDALLIRLSQNTPGAVALFWRMFFLGTTVAVASILRECWLTGSVVPALRKMHDDIVQTGRYSFLILLYPFPISMFVFAMRWTSTANCLVLVGSSPLWSAILSKLILGDDLPMHTTIAVVLGMACVLSIFVFSPREDQGESSNGAAGDMLSLLIAIMLAVYFIVVRVMHERNGGKSVVPLLPFAAYAACACTLAAGTQPSEVAAGDMLWLWLMGGVMAPVAIPAFTIAATMISAPECSLIQLLEMMLGPFWTWLILNETPPLCTIISGACLILVLALHSVYVARLLSRKGDMLHAPVVEPLLEK